MEPGLLKFPTLRVALSEGGIGWLPYFLERVDYIYGHTKYWSGMDLGGRLPSELFSEHVILCFIDDAVGIENRHHLNIDNSPGNATIRTRTAPGRTPRKCLMRSLTGVTDDEIDKITHLNAMRHFSYDPFAHIPREQATVSALRHKLGLGHQHQVGQAPSARRRGIGTGVLDEAARQGRRDHRLRWRNRGGLRPPLREGGRQGRRHRHRSR